METKINSGQYSVASFLGFLYEVRFIILFYVLGDWLTTWYAIPYAYEGNPIPAMVLEKYGIFHLLYLKFLFIFILFFCAGVIKNSPSRWAFTKHFIELAGLVLTVSNLMVVWVGISIFQAIGLI